MADKPKNDEKTTATDDKGTQVHPDGMNPHAEPATSEKETEKED